MELSNLPPDPDNKNDERAEWAQEALRTFKKETHQTDSKEALGDLIADLLHLADRFGMDANVVIELAKGCYKDETRPEESWEDQMTDNELNEAVGYIAGWRKSPDGKKWKSQYARAYYTYKIVGAYAPMTNVLPWYLERLDLVTHTIRGLPNDLQWAFFTKLAELADSNSPAFIAPTKVWCEALVAVAYHVDTA